MRRADHRTMRSGRATALADSGSADQMTSLLRCLTTVIVLFAMAGCNALEGFGRDVETAGDEIEESAQ